MDVPGQAHRIKRQPEGFQIAVKPLVNYLKDFINGLTAIIFFPRRRSAPPSGVEIFAYQSPFAELFGDALYQSDKTSF
jgi:hypothetical protein